MSAFLDISRKPTPTAIAAHLGSCSTIWSEFIAFISEQFAPVVNEWKFMKSGWVLVPNRKTRTVCYLFPEEHSFTVAIVLGEKAVAAARSSKLPKRILDDIEAARPYAEGRGIRVKITKPSDLAHLKTLAVIKMNS